MYKSLKIRNICLYGMFLVMMFWDVMEKILPYSQFVVLLLLFLLCAIKSKIKVNSKFMLFVSIVFLHGCINCVLGNDSIPLLIKQISAITVSFIAFDTIISTFEINRIFNVYFNAALFMSIIGFLLQGYSLINGVFDYRMSSLCSEPSFLCYFLAPVVCLIIFSFISPEYSDFNYKNRKKSSLIILLAYLFTFSSIALLGLLLMILLATYKKRIGLKKIMIPTIGITVALIAYLMVPDINMRVNETIGAIKGTETESINWSSYTYYNNYQVTIQTVKSNFGLGGGLGSYQNYFDIFTLGKNKPSLYNLNREDANSALFRLISEIGIIGIVWIFMWLKRYYVNCKNKYFSYSNSVFVLLLLFLLRQGNYVHGGSVLFLCLYIKIWKEYNANRIANKTFDMLHY